MSPTYTPTLTRLRPVPAQRGLKKCNGRIENKIEVKVKKVR
jgi:hypothetical protein